SILLSTLSPVAGVTVASAREIAPPDAPPVAADQAAGTVPVLVKFKAGVNATDMDNAVKGAGGQTVRHLAQTRTRVVNVPAGARDQVLAAFAKQPGVERADAAIKLKKTGDPNDPGYAQQWALPKIAWNQAYGAVPISGT